MEGWEELCRMGVWDFAVTMSGADLPLRSVEDLALGLAPHRGVVAVLLYIMKTSILLQYS